MQGILEVGKKELETKLRVSSALFSQKESWQERLRRSRSLLPMLEWKPHALSVPPSFLHGRLHIFQAPAKFSSSCLLLLMRHNVTDCRATPLHTTTNGTSTFYTSNRKKPVLPHYTLSRRYHTYRRAATLSDIKYCTSVLVLYLCSSLDK